MGAHGVLGHLDHDVAAAAPALLPGENLQAAYVGDEVAVPDRTVLRHPRLALAREAFGVRGEAVAEGERVIEHEIEVAEEIHQRRRRGYTEETRRLVAAAVEMLPPGIERRGKQ